MTATARALTGSSARLPHEVAPGTVVPTWIPTPHGSLAAHVHAPYGVECRGAAILLAPFGPAEVSLRPALRALADLLARRGCVVIRADWSGTAESAAPLGDDEAVPSMARRLADVSALAGYARDVLGQRDLTLIGAGLGATLAALALGDPRGPRPDPDGSTAYRALVLLDPHAGQDPWIRLPDARPAAAGDTRILLVRREEAAVEPAIEDYARRIGADRFEAIDLDALDAPDGATHRLIPVETWEVLTDWLALESRCPTPVPAIGPACPAAVGDGAREEHVDVAGLPGILTTPPTPARHSLLLISDEGDHRGGPGGDGWVRLARAAARHGVATLRVDRGGAGEAREVGWLLEDDAPLVSTGSVAEHVAVVEWLAARTGHRPTIVGRGAGAWVALSVAGRVSVPRVVSVSQRAWSTDPDEGRPLGPWWFAHLPYAALLRLARTRALATPQPLIEAATARGAAVDLYGDTRHGALFAAARGDEAMARLRGQGARVHRYVEHPDQDRTEAELLDLMLGRVLGRVLRDVERPEPEASAAQGAADEAPYATIRAPLEAGDVVARPGARLAAPGYATA